MKTVLLGFLPVTLAVSAGGLTLQGGRSMSAVLAAVVFSYSLAATAAIVIAVKAAK